MATLTAMRDAIAATVQVPIPLMHCYARVQDVVNLPALVVGPPKVDFTIAFKRGLDQWEFELYILVAIPEMDSAQKELDIYCAGSGASSIREIFFNNNTMGGVVEDCIVTAMDNYGGNYSTAKIPHVGACIKLTAYTSGSS